MVIILLIFIAALALWGVIIKIFAAQVSKKEPQREQNKEYNWDSFEKSGEWKE